MANMAEVIDWKVQLFKLNYDEREYAAVEDVLKSGWLTMGQRIMDFEAAFGNLLGQGAKCLAVANGTAALHIAVLAAGVGIGDEVIVPSLTFIADLNAVRVTGGEAVLADLTSKSDWAMDPADIEGKINGKTKAVLIVHYAGYACDMDAILSICRKNKLALIEDCAHAPGGDYKGQKLGTFGDLSAWSFFSNKNLAVGEGGMVVTKDGALYQKCKNLRSHGMTVASFDRMKGRAVSYDVLEPGFNYRMDEIRASLGLVQLQKLANSNKRRGELTMRYFARLDAMEGVALVPFRQFDRGLPTWHIMPILLDEGVDRMKVVESMKEDGIQTSIHYPSIQSFTAYRDRVGPTPLAQYISEHELTLPLYPTMTDEEVDLVCDALAKAIRSRKAGKTPAGSM
jgi:dTDP-4-amino-4,6-dideoxygalactose transaminase